MQILFRATGQPAGPVHTVLTALRTSLELAPEDDFVRQAQVQVERLEALTSGLLDLVRLERRNRHPPFAPVALVPLVQGMGELYASRAEQAGLALALYLPQVPLSVPSDEAQLRCALANLLDNSLKFTPEGGSVHLWLRCEDRTAELGVDDTGIGIPEKDLPHLFERFHCGRNAEAYPGSGLGLAIVKAIATSHGGSIEVQRLDPGTRFTLRLPLAYSRTAENPTGSLAVRFGTCYNLVTRFPMRNEIRTKRLKLIALTLDQLPLLLEAPDQLEGILGYPISRDNVAEPVRRAIGMKLAKMSRVAAELHPWYTYWLVVVTGEPYGAGLAGFKGAPDEDGVVEIGYGIDPGYRNQGYTTEAAQALIAWAFQDPACCSVIAPDTRKDNPASNRVLAKAGMRVYAETGDTLSWRIEKPL